MEVENESLPSQGKAWHARKYPFSPHAVFFTPESGTIPNKLKLFPVKWHTFDEIDPLQNSGNAAFIMVYSL